MIPYFINGFFLIQKDVDIPNAEGWTPMMIAAQLGKNEYVKTFLAAGAEFEREVNRSSSLTLAVKAGQLKTTQLLLEVGACIKKDNTESIKKSFLLFILLVANRIHSFWICC